MRSAAPISHHVSTLDPTCAHLRTLAIRFEHTTVTPDRMTTHGTASRDVPHAAPNREATNGAQSTQEGRTTAQHDPRA